MNSRTNGERWERVAESFLQTRGLKTLKRNFSSRFGEIDIIMEDGAIVAFVEVKYQKRIQHGGAAVRVDSRKQQRLEKTAAIFLAYNAHQANRPCRFDVVAIQGDGRGYEINWIQDAFQVAQR